MVRVRAFEKRVDGTGVKWHGEAILDGFEAYWGQKRSIGEPTRSLDERAPGRMDLDGVAQLVRREV